MKIVEAIASHNQADVALAFDGEVGTRWTTGTPMVPTMSFAVVLDAPAMLTEVHAWSATWPDDNPRKWVVSVMDSTGGHGRQEIAQGEGAIQLVFPPVRGQVVRIEQTGSDPEMWWSIEHLNIVGETITVEPPPVVPPVVPPGTVLVCDPSQFGEAAARQFVEAWAGQFKDWWCYQSEWRNPSGELTRIDLHVSFTLERAKPGEPGVLEVWPFG